MVATDSLVILSQPDARGETTCRVSAMTLDQPTHAEGDTPAIAAVYLAGQLTRVLDAPLDSSSRESAERALGDHRLSIQSHEFPM